MGFLTLLLGEDEGTFPYMKNACIMLSRNIVLLLNLGEKYGQKSIMGDEWSKRWPMLDCLLATRQHACLFVHSLPYIRENTRNYRSRNQSSKCFWDQFCRYLSILRGNYTGFGRHKRSPYSLAATLNTMGCQKQGTRVFSVASGEPEDHDSPFGSWNHWGFFLMFQWQPP